MILICVPAAALNINLLIIAGIAGLFALYHYMCLNTCIQTKPNLSTILRRAFLI